MQTLTQRALGLLLLRVILIALSMRLAALLFGDAMIMLGALFLLPVNLVTWLVVRRFARAEHAPISFRPGRSWPRELLWALLWLVLFSVAFAAVINVTVFLITGDLNTGFTTIFAVSDPELPPGLLLALGLATLVTYGLFNAPVEEALYRGYAQSRLGGARGIWVPSFFFGVQHMFFAPTLPGAIVYGAAFFVWGLLSAWVVARQGRLLPVTLTHLLVNLGSTIPAVVFPALMLAGVPLE
ncbi:CPBP family intramembrane glutamic endopeptidase [Glutamicibacter sp. X7]